MNFNRITFDLRVVLVRSIYERNIGATSRAMSNMGFHRLILVAPQCELTYEAQKAAATGQEGLQNRITYPSWDEFLKNEPDSIRICFSAKNGKARQAFLMEDVYANIQQNAPQLNGEEPTTVVFHLIFGQEDWGLSNDDLKVAHHCAFIPTYGVNSSLNLAQAALVAMFGFRQAFGGELTVLEGNPFTKINPDKQNVFPDITLKTWLEEMGFDLSQRKINVYSVLRRMLLQNTPTQKELTILETVLQQSIRKLREWKEFQRKKES
ncbi:MAG: TrmH family RNA methyltransferase [Pseudobdellovibrionaceae bacterium]|jgi:tRNA/rRNA methyltransferase